MQFSIIIPSWNNLPFLQLCIQSIQKYSAYEHEIVVHVNEGEDNTAAWLEKEQIKYTFSAENIGVCKAVNLAYTKCTKEYIVYMNDDMHVLPDWDKYLVDEIQKIGHQHFYMSATLIEPRNTGNPCVLAPYDFGDTIETFRLDDLLKVYTSYKKENWNGATWPPSLVHRTLWERVGGYSEEFSPGLYSDPDFSMKLYQLGIRVFIGVGNARVYHFMSKSLKRVPLNNGRKQFLQKWKIPASYFRREMLKTGDLYAVLPTKHPKGLLYFIQKLRGILN